MGTPPALKLFTNNIIISKVPEIPFWCKYCERTIRIENKKKGMDYQQLTLCLQLMKTNMTIKSHKYIYHQYVYQIIIKISEDPRVSKYYLQQEFQIYNFLQINHIKSPY